MTKAVHVPYTVEEDEDGSGARTRNYGPALARTARELRARRRLTICVRLSQA